MSGVAKVFQNPIYEEVCCWRVLLGVFFFETVPLDYLKEDSTCSISQFTLRLDGGVGPRPSNDILCSKTLKHDDKNSDSITHDTLQIVVIYKCTILFGSCEN